MIIKWKILQSIFIILCIANVLCKMAYSHMSPSQTGLGYILAIFFLVNILPQLQDFGQLLSKITVDTIWPSVIKYVYKCKVIIILLQYPWGRLAPGTPTDSKICGYLSPLYKMVYYLHKTYTYSTVFWVISRLLVVLNMI
jgi:hypothetical protein